MLRRLFLDHPRCVGETYAEHQRSAFGFGGWLVVAGIACFVHGVIPGIFQRTASRIVARLHDRMVVSRTRRVAQSGAVARVH